MRKGAAYGHVMFTCFSTLVLSVFMCSQYPVGYVFSCSCPTRNNIIYTINTIYNVRYDQHYNNTFHQKLETVQYNAVLAITGAIRGSSRETFIKN